MNEKRILGLPKSHWYYLLGCVMGAASPVAAAGYIFIPVIIAIAFCGMVVLDYMFAESIEKDNENDKI